MTAFVDTNIIVRHLTGDPPDLAHHATRFLREAHELLLADLIVAETVYVLESFYEVPRERVADLVRAIIAFPPVVVVVDEQLLLRAVEVYEMGRLDFVEAYLVASAEVSGVCAVASFNKAVGRMTTVRHIVPGRHS
jgi:predicted nucleic-acid-binding protein